MPASRLITAITAALQAKIGAFWTAQSFPGSPPTISDMEGALSAMFDTTMPDVIQPLSGAPSGNVIYNTIPTGPQIYRVLIPAAYLVAASGGPWTLTLGTGSGSTVIVPISPTGYTVLSGNLLFTVYVDASGNVTSDSWDILTQDPGLYNWNTKQYSDGTQEAWGIGPAITATNGENSISVNFPISFSIAPSVTFTLGWPPTCWGNFVEGISVSTNGFTIEYRSGCAQNITGYQWMAMGRWR